MRGQGRCPDKSLCFDASKDAQFICDTSKHRLGDIILSPSTQSLYVQNVLLASRRELVPNQIVSGNNGCFDVAIDNSLDSVFPGCIEVNAVYDLQNIDPGWWLADLEAGTIRKVGWRETFERSSVLRQRPKYRFAVLIIRTDKNVQVFGCTWLCVNAKCVAAYDEIFNSVIVECA